MLYAARCVTILSFEFDFQGNTLLGIAMLCKEVSLVIHPQVLLNLERPTLSSTIECKPDPCLAQYAMGHLMLSVHLPISFITSFFPFPFLGRTTIYLPMWR